MSQVMHNEQLADRKSVAGTASQIDDMYESLAANDQKVPTADQVKHDDLLEAMETFGQQLTEVSTQGISPELLPRA